MLNFGHFWAPPPPSPLTFHNVKNHGGGGAEREPGELPNKQQRKTLGAGQYSPCFFGENVAGVLGVLGVLVCSRVVSRVVLGLFSGCSRVVLGLFSGCFLVVLWLFSGCLRGRPKNGRVKPDIFNITLNVHCGNFQTPRACGHSPQCRPLVGPVLQLCSRTHERCVKEIPNLMYRAPGVNRKALCTC